MNIKELKEQFIIDQATNMFLKNSIEDITIKDISIGVGVGEATVYRMFGKKENIVTKVAIKLQKEIFESYFKFKEEETGFQKINEFYLTFLKIYEEHIEYFKFINDFDNFMISTKYKELKDYETNMNLFLDEYKNAYEKGQEDLTIRKIDDIELFYFTTMNALLNLCKKLASNPILDQDGKNNKKQQIETLINLIMFNLKK